MSPGELEKLEEARCAAMTMVDLDALDRLFADDLRWIHASGKVDTKSDMITQFANGSMRCFTIERSDEEYRTFGSTGVATGLVTMDAMTNGVRKQVVSRYTGVWSAYENTPRLISWQSARAN